MPAEMAHFRTLHPTRGARSSSKQKSGSRAAAVQTGFYTILSIPQGTGKSRKTLRRPHLALSSSEVSTNLLDFWMPFVPVGMLLKGSRGLNYGKVISRPGDKLKPDGKILLRKSAGNRECGEPANISYTSQRIGERQAGF